MNNRTAKISRRSLLSLGVGALALGVVGVALPANADTTEELDQDLLDQGYTLLPEDEPGPEPQSAEPNNLEALQGNWQHTTSARIIHVKGNTGFLRSPSEGCNLLGEQYWGGISGSNGTFYASNSVRNPKDCSERTGTIDFKLTFSGTTLVVASTLQYTGDRLKYGRKDNYTLIRRNPLVDQAPSSAWFDASVYGALYPDLASYQPSLYDHFVYYGVAEERTPSFIYSPKFYRNANADLAAFDGPNRLDHWLNHGIKEGRAASPVFDLATYRVSNSDLASFDNFGLIEHFIQYGVDEGRVASPTFNVRDYAASKPGASLSNRGWVLNFLQDWVARS